jgi:hypothetical protein
METVESLSLLESLGLQNIFGDKSYLGAQNLTNAGTGMAGPSTWNNQAMNASNMLSNWRPTEPAPVLRFRGSRYARRELKPEHF